MGSEMCIRDRGEAVVSGKLDGRNRDEDEDHNENIGEVMRTPRC